MEWIAEGEQGAEIEIYSIVQYVERFPEGTRVKLQKFLGRHCQDVLPRVFRHLFVRDREATRELTRMLADQLGFYLEMDFTTLIRPLPGGEEEGGGEERPAKRQRLTNSGKGLITSFGENDEPAQPQIVEVSDDEEAEEEGLGELGEFGNWTEREDPRRQGGLMDDCWMSSCDGLF